ncbi:hypothetical protein FOZ63_023896 [Perkinsus olseni]|uniref:Uncharacterized protein n=2 Tax=Perkinsus olseni TaxID=32597 RepID=A0A7J6PXG4_PEROL|nr:hypothetical protein FOZ63_023896 [Perkinsus olseni]
MNPSQTCALAEATKPVKNGAAVGQRRSPRKPNPFLEFNNELESARFDQRSEMLESTQRSTWRTTAGPSMAATGYPRGNRHIDTLRREARMHAMEEMSGRGLGDLCELRLGHSSAVRNSSQLDPLRRSPYGMDLARVAAQSARRNADAKKGGLRDYSSMPFVLLPKSVDHANRLREAMYTLCPDLKPRSKKAEILDNARLDVRSLFSKKQAAAEADDFDPMQETLEVVCRIVQERFEGSFRAFFFRVDENGNGIVSMREFDQGVRRMHLSDDLTPARIFGLFSYLKATDSRMLHWEQFSRIEDWYTAKQEAAKKPPSPTPQERAAQDRINLLRQGFQDRARKARDDVHHTGFADFGGDVKSQRISKAAVTGARSSAATGRHGTVKRQASSSRGFDRTGTLTRLDRSKSGTMLDKGMVHVVSTSLQQPRRLPSGIGQGGPRSSRYNGAAKPRKQTAELQSLDGQRQSTHNTSATQLDHTEAEDLPQLSEWSEDISEVEASDYQRTDPRLLLWEFRDSLCKITVFPNGDPHHGGRLLIVRRHRADDHDFSLLMVDCIRQGVLPLGGPPTLLWTCDSFQPVRSLHDLHDDAHYIASAGEHDVPREERLPPSIRKKRQEFLNTSNVGSSVDATRATGETVATRRLSTVGSTPGTASDVLEELSTVLSTPLYPSAHATWKMKAIQMMQKANTARLEDALLDRGIVRRDRDHLSMVRRTRRDLKKDLRFIRRQLGCV